MANEDNLIPFQKGQSGNPKGRPVGSKNRSTIAKKWLEIEQKLKNPLTNEVEKMSQEDLMTLALIKKAREGDTQAYQKLLDSAYGQPLQQIEQTNIEQPLFPDVKEDDGDK
jgi:transposase